MKKFIVSQSRNAIIEVQNRILIEPYLNAPYLFKIKCGDFIIARDLNKEEADNQLLLIADFLNRKGTINDSVYYMPVKDNKK